MNGILLLVLLLSTSTVFGAFTDHSIKPKPDQLTRHYFSHSTTIGKRKIIHNNTDSTALHPDTIYYPYYNDVQMIKVCQVKRYNDLYLEDIIRSASMSQIQYFPSPPLGDELFFRTINGAIIRAYNTEYSLEELTQHFQSTTKTKKDAKFHSDFFIAEDPYYASQNIWIHNGYYTIANGGVHQNDWALLENSIPDKMAKYGLIDTLGNIILDTLYDQILTMPNGFLAQKEGKWGIINKNQKVVLPFLYDRHSTDYYNSKKYPRSSELTYFFLNTRFKVAYFMKEDSLIPIPEYTHSLSSKKGFFIITEDGKHGVIDVIHNEVLLPPIYEGSYPYFEFHDLNMDYYNLEYTYIIAEKNGKFGLVNLKNKVILPFIYDKIFSKQDSSQDHFKVILNGKTIEIKQ